MATEMKCRVRDLSALLCALVFATPSLADPFFPAIPCPASPNPLAGGGIAQPERLDSAAPNLNRPHKIIPLGCNRPFLYRGEIYSTDSPQAQDAQTLKTITRASPEAQVILTEYQENRKKSRISAYTGTLGTVIAVFSTGFGRWLAPRDPKILQTAALLTGAAIAVEGFSYSLMLLRRNEDLLPRAASAYNQTKPKDPVELQFTAGWSF